MLCTGFKKLPPSHFIDFGSFDAAFTWTGGALDRPAFIPAGSTYKVENMNGVCICARPAWIEG